MLRTYYLSDFTGNVYTMDDDALLCTPLYEDMTYDTCLDNWILVEPETMEQGSDEKVHVEWVRNKLIDNGAL